jgi:hypothetical protein
LVEAHEVFGVFCGFRECVAASVDFDWSQSLGSGLGISFLDLSLSLSVDRENVEDKTFFLGQSIFISRPYERFALSDRPIDETEVNQRLVDEGMISGMSTNLL